MIQLLSAVFLLNSRIKEGIQPAKGYLSLLKSDILTEINRNASIKQAKEMADAQQLEYVMADKKVHLQEDMIRKIHQKEADEAMDVRNSVFLVACIEYTS